MLLLLAFACLIQLFVSVQRSRSLTSQWGTERDEEARRFERQVREEAGPPK